MPFNTRRTDRHSLLAIFCLQFLLRSIAASAVRRLQRVGIALSDCAHVIIAKAVIRDLFVFLRICNSENTNQSDGM